ncbi:hypothetical protein Krac_10674 [Ktedonobacter racemifer DSM 44963]|uniref:Uncharacterized protein n=2 Tax=Ktedonobacter racemifer TaxID=363277 RepID=D6TI81_KTERA|nr:hypothetical protein Krac_10674 [Ktedonobacter racemifer DSM 44963]
MMQERYDEAEVALKRALGIDPTYTLVKSNLAAFPGFRRTGPLALVALNEPFKDSKLKQTMTFFRAMRWSRETPIHHGSDGKHRGALRASVSTCRRRERDTVRSRSGGTANTVIRLGR